MTHLKIELNNGTREIVVNSVIKKLYDLAKEIELDANGTIALKGWLYTSATYLDYITYLENISKVNGEPLLTIDTGKAYIMFADPAVLSVLATAYGDGVGVTKSDLSGITKIPNRMFENNTTITSFDELGDLTNITELDYYCFSEATNLSSIDLSNIKIMRGNALYSVPLEIINLPKATLVEGGIGRGDTLRELNIGSEVPDNLKITSIPNAFLRDHTAFTTVTGLKMVTEIGSFGFGNTRLSEVDTTSNLTTIGGSAFWVTNIKCIDLSGVTTLSGDGLFNSCSELIDLSTSDPTLINTGAATYTFNWSAIPRYLFYGCKLTNKSFNFPNATSIGENAFRSSGVVGINSPNVTSVGNNAFQECSSLTSIDLSNVTSINLYAFYLCTNLVNIGTLNSSLTTIPDGCFQSCSSLTNIDLSHITNLGYHAFRDCTSLGTGQTLELNLTNLARHFGGALYNTKFSRVILHRSNTVMNGDRNNPPLANLPNATYIDASDFPLPMAEGRTLQNLYGDNSLVTCIYPSNITYLSAEEFNANIGGLKYMIILNTTPPNLNDTDHNNPLSSYFRTNNILHIYVPDSAKADYLANSKWSLLAGLNGSVTITDRLHGLNELPNGVWTTGLASQYLTPALLATS